MKLTPPRLSLPPSPAFLAAIALAFVLPGLAGAAGWRGALAARPQDGTRPALGGSLFGAPRGCAFLSATWIAPACLGIAAPAAHLACEEWRTRSALVFLGIGVPVSLAIGA